MYTALSMLQHKNKIPTKSLRQDSIHFYLNVAT